MKLLRLSVILGRNDRPPVMPGLGPGIHDAFEARRFKDVDGRAKPGHDGNGSAR